MLRRSTVERWRGVEICVKGPARIFEYSDLGYLLLGRIVEMETHSTLNVGAEREIFSPAGMTDTGFRPSGRRANRVAATLGERGQLLFGVVQDPVARRLGGRGTCRSFHDGGGSEKVRESAFGKWIR